ncbi:carboxymuconolactone decarboxylase family protein [Thermoflavimicrobium daqui]|uniref:carboxymuconolactone decarboxylase family protein n=1 Tax=Thermoflavimicrobium daqui TaxID=2137476 RepID=UPI001F0C6B45|nr:carboxymuconolactone decarboxylase family protein [Thermoflavimicrobium daqui]
MSFIQEALLEYKEGIAEFGERLPEVARTYHQFTEACFEEGELSKKTKHLIGVSLGSYTNDEYCIIFHVKGALDQGASEKEVLEAAAVSGAFGGGMAMSQAVTLVQEALREFQNNVH